MTDNGICSLLGLAMRAGKLAAGDEPVRELSQAGIVRAVFLANDAGNAAARQAAFIAERAGVPLMTIPADKQTLGGALGRKTCAMCALSDSGFASRAAEKLAAIDPAYREAAEILAASHARFQARKVKKKKDSRLSQQKPKPTPTGKRRLAASTKRAGARKPPSRHTKNQPKG